MKLTSSLGLRRIINSYFDPFSKVPSPDRWLQREKIQRFTAWQNSSYRDIYKHASIKLRYKLMAYYSMHRQDESRLEKHYSEIRVTNALAEHDFEYKHFKNMLDKAHILIDNNTLAKLAIYEPQSFHSLVALAKEMAQQEGREVMPDREERKYDVQLCDSMFGEPYPRPMIFPKGAAENHKVKPKKLEPNEY